MAASSGGLAYGPLGEGCLHLCVDMQRLFEAGAPWAIPWMDKVLPVIEAIAARHTGATVFTRFIPARRPGEGVGAWARYYERWADVTLENLDPQLVNLVPSLARLVPPAKVLDKWVYSPWTEGRLDVMLRSTRIHTLVITGGETDVCVLATVLGAIDRGYRVVIVTDAVCGSADPTHDALMGVYRTRFSTQVEAADAETVLSAWRVA